MMGSDKAPETKKDVAADFLPGFVANGRLPGDQLP